MAVRIIADSLAMTARSSEAVLQARTLRIKSLSFIDILANNIDLMKEREGRPVGEPHSSVVVIGFRTVVVGAAVAEGAAERGCQLRKIKKTRANSYSQYVAVSFLP